MIGAVFGCCEVASGCAIMVCSAGSPLASFSTYLKGDQGGFVGSRISGMACGGIGPLRALIALLMGPMAAWRK
jgi:hypothetical protein